MAGESLIKSVSYLFGGFGSVFERLTGFASNVTVESSATPPIIPSGTYQLNQYTVDGKITLQQQIGVSSGNNYYKINVMYWNPENPSYISDTFLGGNMP